jgi:hypothetical protein
VGTPPVETHIDTAAHGATDAGGLRLVVHRPALLLTLVHDNLLNDENSSTPIRGSACESYLN